MARAAQAAGGEGKSLCREGDAAAASGGLAAEKLGARPGSKAALQHTALSAAAAATLSAAAFSAAASKSRRSAAASAAAAAAALSAAAFSAAALSAAAFSAAAFSSATFIAAATFIASKSCARTHTHTHGARSARDVAIVAVLGPGAL